MTDLDRPSRPSESDLDHPTARQERHSRLEDVSTNSSTGPTIPEAIADLDRRMQEMAEERRVLVTVWERMGGRATPSTVGTSIDNSWLILGRGEAAVKVLEETGLSMSPSDIAKALREHGRDDKPSLVSAGLNWAAKQGRAHSPARGLWRAGPSPAQVETARDDMAKETE